MVKNDKIYVSTYLRQDNKEKYIIMDLKGKIIKKTYLPKFKNVTLVESVLGTKLHTLIDDKLIYLTENEDEEE